jgi:hypothetical protein
MGCRKLPVADIPLLLLVHHLCPPAHPAQAAGFQYIKSKGLIPDDDDSDDYVPDPESVGIEW